MHCSTSGLFRCGCWQISNHGQEPGAEAGVMLPRPVTPRKSLASAPFIPSCTFQAGPADNARAVGGCTTLERDSNLRLVTYFTFDELWRPGYTHHPALKYPRWVGTKHPLPTRPTVASSLHPPESTSAASMPPESALMAPISLKPPPTAQLMRRNSHTTPYT